MRRSDKVLTLALCLSLMVHGFIVWSALRERLNILLAKLHDVPVKIAQAKVLEKLPATQPAMAEPLPQPGGYVVQEKVQTVLPFEPPKISEKKKELEKEKEWGEPDKDGIALSTTTGKDNMKTPKEGDDQAFASRDPQGPGDLPEDPSLSLIPAGSNGDGRRPMNDALAGKGTDGNPLTVMNKPDGNSARGIVPKLAVRHSPAKLQNNRDASLNSTGQQTSAMARVQRKSPAEWPAFPAVADDENTTVLSNRPSQQLPTEESDLIARKVLDQDWTPATVNALVSPPGRDNIEGLEQLLPEIAPADIPKSPRIAAATHGLTDPGDQVIEIAEKMGQSEEQAGVDIALAMINSPGDVDDSGQKSFLPQIAPADRPGDDQVQDAIVSLVQPTPESLALEPLPIIAEKPSEKLPVDKAVDPTMIAATDHANDTQAIAIADKNASPQVAKSNDNSQATNATKAVGGLPGAALPAADAAQDVGMESDAFAKIPSIEYRDGKVDARSGRRVTTIRPRLSEAGKRELLANQFPTVVVKVNIDKTGKVTHVDMVRGSGNQAVDMPIYRAMWQWWFEPPKDKQGNPLPDTQIINLHWS